MAQRWDVDMGTRGVRRAPSHTYTRACLTSSCIVRLPLHSHCLDCAGLRLLLLLSAHLCCQRNFRDPKVGVRPSRCREGESDFRGETAKTAKDGKRTTKNQKRSASTDLRVTEGGGKRRRKREKKRKQKSLRIIGGVKEGGEAGTRAARTRKGRSEQVAVNSASVQTGKGRNRNELCAANREGATQGWSTILASDINSSSS